MLLEGMFSDRKDEARNQAEQVHQRVVLGVLRLLSGALWVGFLHSNPPIGLGFYIPTHPLGYLVGCQEPSHMM
jgi:hypothetical protein